MQEFLTDLLNHTHKLGCIDLLKIRCDGKSTHALGYSDDRTLIAMADFDKPLPDVTGVFGMPNLKLLSTWLTLEQYKTDVEITIQKDSNGSPSELKFKSDDGVYKNSYRFMSDSVVQEKLRDVTFRVSEWDVEFSPSNAEIDRFRFSAAAAPKEKLFRMITEDNNLMVFFGNPSSSTGATVWKERLAGELKAEHLWPVDHILNILKLDGDMHLSVSDVGAIQIKVTTDHGVYTYILPAHTR